MTLPGQNQYGLVLLEYGADEVVGGDRTLELEGLQTSIAREQPDLYFRVLARRNHLGILDLITSSGSTQRHLNKTTMMAAQN